MNPFRFLIAMALLCYLAVLEWNDQRKLRKADGYYPEGEE